MFQVTERATYPGRAVVASASNDQTDECGSSGTCRRIIDCSAGELLQEDSAGPGVI